MSIFYANRYFDRFEDVTPDILNKEGVKFLMCDLDNTLKVRRDFEPEEALVDWVSACKKAGVYIIVVSNNMKAKKVQKFCEKIGVDCVWSAKKPMSKELTAAMKERGFSKEETVMMGDKWSTDVLAAKFAGVRVWKVEHRRGILSDFEKYTKKTDFKRHKVIRKAAKKEVKNAKK